MKLFDRIPRPGRPRIDNKLLSTPETKSDPVTPIPDTVTVIANLCAHCGVEGATHQYTSGDMYLKTLPYTFFCDACWEQRQWLVQHPIARQHTRQEHAAVKPRRTRLTRIEQASLLEERAHNLGA